MIRWLCVFGVFGIMMTANAGNINTESVYQDILNDPEAVYFTPQNFSITADGRTDVSDELQKAIDLIKTEKNFGILFIPAGKYRISKTIYIPKAVRLIGYGRERPLIFLAENSPGYQKPVESDKGRANYMFWFTSGTVDEGESPRDAGAGTFYSAISNINLKINDGNPHAVALRTHFAQHSFVENMVIDAGNGKAGLYDVGNEMDNVAFYGGEYGIYTTKTSPSWPMMMIDTYFEGQRKAAIFSQEGGLVIMRMHARNVPAVIEIREKYSDRIFMEDCRLEQVSGPALIISNENNYTNQISLRNVDCRDVPILAYYRRSGKESRGTGEIYKIRNYTHGIHMDSMTDDPAADTRADLLPLDTLPAFASRDIPRLPATEDWVNLRELGAVGDGKTDNTKIFQDALEQTVEAIPGRPVYISDEYDARMVRMDVKEEGTLSNLQHFAEQGEFGSAVDEKGNLYVANGQIYVYNPDGDRIGVIKVPERPAAIQFGGKDKDILFITARSSLYGVRIPK